MTTYTDEQFQSIAMELIEVEKDYDKHLEIAKNCLISTLILVGIGLFFFPVLIVAVIVFLMFLDSKKKFGVCRDKLNEWSNNQEYMDYVGRIERESQSANA